MANNNNADLSLQNITLMKPDEIPWRLPGDIDMTTGIPRMCISLHSPSSMNYMCKQLFLTMAVTVVANLLLDPLGIPTSVSHLVAGFVMGPSVLGLIPGYKEYLFPLSTSIMLDSYAGLGMLFQLFLIGVQVNPSLILKSRKKAVCIGTLVVVVPLVLASTFAFTIAAILNLNDDQAKSIMTLAVVQSISSFPVVVFYMYELNIVSLEFSQIAYSCSMVSGVLCAALFGTITLYFTNDTKQELLLSLAAHVAVFMLVLYALRPGINWIIDRVPKGQTVKEIYMCPVYLAVMALTIFCMIGRVNWLFGPFLVGIIIPSGSSLGTTLVKRFEIFNTWTMMPVFYLAHGMMIDLSKLHSKRGLVMESVVIVSYIGKFLGAALPALYYNMSFNEAVLLGLTMNVQGFLEIAGYKILIMTHIIDAESFQVMAASMIFMTLILTPLLRYLYKNSLKHKANCRSTRIAEPNMKLRVLACVYNQENVPSIIHLLKAINPTKENPVNASIIHFVERVGHAVPLIINHTIHSQSSSATAGSQRIINVFKTYEDRNRQSISVHPYTVVSHHTSLPNDVCTLAEQQQTSLIILPYHKELGTGILNSDLRTVNCEVLDKAPCSVGILIDRGLLGGIKYVLENWTAYHVAMIFFGGADDREALTHAARMSTHPTIELTVIRILSDYPNPTYTAKTEMAIDNEMILHFKQTHAYNKRVTFVEQEVEDGLEVIQLLESVAQRYELIIFGRQHDQNSPIILGLTEWNECSELGTIGDISTSSNYGGRSTILIVQQQKNAPRRVGSLVQDEEAMMHHYEEEVPFQGENSIRSC